MTASLVYLTNCSLDGYIEDRNGGFAWIEPTDDLFAFYTEQLRSLTTYLYGRRLYETMAVWETDPAVSDASPLAKDFADTWQAADKIVYSTTLTDVPTRRTRIERTFEPAAVRDVLAGAPDDVLIGGAELAGHAFRAGIVDECRMLFLPVIVGGGKPALPRDLFLELRLLEERRFEGGVAYLRYAVRR